jgi:plexin A
LFRSDIPAVASRSLEDANMFQLARQEVTTGTRMFVNALSREQYPIHYVYGFSSDRFSYFLTVQMKGTESSNFISKLVRVCQDDEDYYSYTEIPIDCIGSQPNGTVATNYNLVQAAYLGKPGSDLAKHLEVDPQDDVLFAVFAQSDPTEGDLSSKPGKNSALCVYALKYIRRKFLENIKKCFRGEAQRGLAFISPSNNCTTTVGSLFTYIFLYSFVALRSSGFCVASSVSK